MLGQQSNWGHRNLICNPGDTDNIVLFNLAWENKKQTKQQKNLRKKLVMYVVYEKMVPVPYLYWDQSTTRTVTTRTVTTCLLATG